MSSYIYVDIPNANLVCCICRCPFVEPCITRTCCHTFCYECISQAVAINRQCPIDRTPLSIHDLAPADPVVRNLVDELVVKCPQEPLGCTYSCQRLLLPVHLRDGCQYVQFACPEAKCSRRILRKDLQGHQCQDNIPDEPTVEGQQPIEAQSDGRQANGETATDAAQQTPESQQPDLAAENAILRLRLSALENVVHTLRSEMLAVKHALGPWYRPEVELQLHSEHDREAPPVAISSEPPEHTLPDNVDVHNAASRAEPSPPPTATLGDASDISSYFPPVEEVAAQASSRPHRTRAITDAHPPYVVPSNARPQSITSPTASYPAARANPPIGAGQHTMYAPGSYPTAGPIPGIPYSQPSALPTPSPATVSVPPLDPSMPLPDTLASLHSSLVTLAGALGALAAARGSDALRTTEELRGLRAAMHALRMQVHDILTARTHLAGQGPGGAVGGTGDGDAADAPPLGLGAPPWPIYGPRPHGYPAMYPHVFPPPQLGVPHPPPTNITKL